MDNLHFCDKFCPNKLNQKSKNINSTNYHKKVSTLVVAIPASNGVTPTSDYVADCIADCVALVNGVALVSNAPVTLRATPSATQQRHH